MPKSVAKKGVVKLKPRPAPGPAIVLRRRENGIGFYVGSVDKAGAEDFRSLEEFEDFDLALRAAKERAHRIRLPIENRTGIEPEPATPLKHYQATAQSTAEVSQEPSGATSQKVHTSLSYDDFRGSSDNAVGNPFRWSEEKTKAEILHDITERDLGEHMKSADLSSVRDVLVVTAAGTCQAHDLIRRLGMTVEALSQQSVVIDRLAAKVRALQPMEYRGLWQEGETYPPNHCVTRGGSLWIAERATSEMPATPDSGWRLAVKKGRDGKDLRA